MFRLHWSGPDVVARTQICLLCGCGLQVYVQVNREAECDESVRSAAAEFFRRLERGEDQALALWRQFREITVDEYKRIYQVKSVLVHQGFMRSYLGVPALKTRASVEELHALCF